VACHLEHITDEVEDFLLVIHHQELPRRRQGNGLGRCLDPIGFRCRQLDLETAAFTHLAVYGNFAIIPVQETVGYAQPKPELAIPLVV